MSYVSRELREVRIRRGNDGFGFNIIGATYKYGVFVSLVQITSPAHTAGLLRGDQIVKINSIPVSGLSHAQVSDMLKCGSLVILLVQHRPEEYRLCESDLLQLNGTIHAIAQLNMDRNNKTNSPDRVNVGLTTLPPIPVIPLADPELSDGTSSNGSLIALTTESDHSEHLVASPKRSFYVRVLYSFEADNDASIPGKGLNLKHGDILYLLNASDVEWWQARKLHPKTSEWISSVGLVPSRARLARKQRQRARHVNFATNDIVIANSTSATLTRSSFRNDESPSSSINANSLNNKTQQQRLYVTKDGVAGSSALCISQKQSSSSLCKSDLPSNPSSASTINNNSSSTNNVATPKKRYAAIFKRFGKRNNRNSTSKGNNGVNSALDTRARSLDSMVAMSDNDAQQYFEMFYVNVRQISIEITRPVFIMGALKERVCQCVTNQYPQRFKLISVPESVCVGESHSVVCQQLNQQLELLTINNQHAILPIEDIDTLIRLKNCHSKFYPLSLLLRYRGAMHLRQVCNSSSSLCDASPPTPVDSYLRLWNLAQQLQSDELAHYFTASVCCDSMNNLYEQVLALIEDNSGNKIWISTQQTSSSS